MFQFQFILMYELKLKKPTAENLFEGQRINNNISIENFNAEMKMFPANFLNKRFIFVMKRIKE